MTRDHIGQSMRPAPTLLETGHVRFGGGREETYPSGQRALRLPYYVRTTVTMLARSDTAHEAAIESLRRRLDRVERKVGIAK
jgi:hypothetical protein